MGLDRRPLFHATVNALLKSLDFELNATRLAISFGHYQSITRVPFLIGRSRSFVNSTSISWVSESED